MICAIDIGNTKTKACLFNEKLVLINEKSWHTPDLYEPDRWKYFFDYLYNMDPLFFLADLRISCVSWKAFLALKVHLGYDTLADFNTHREFNSDLLILPIRSPIVTETHIPLKRNFTQGLIGTDRMLAAYAAYRVFQKTSVIASLGTATTIDLVTNNGVFLSGMIMPGIDSAYNGLISRATSLPPISDLHEPQNIVSHNVFEALYAGTFMAQAIVIESCVEKFRKDADLQSDIMLILTGGRLHSIEKHVKQEFKAIDNLVAYGLALIPDWKGSNASKLIEDRYIKDLQKTLGVSKA